MKHIVCFACLLFLFYPAPAQKNAFEGKKFWLTFLNNNPNPNFLLTLTCGRTASAQVRISIPQVSGFTPILLNLAASSSINVPLSINGFYPLPSEAASGVGILITSTNDISVSALNYSGSLAEVASIYPIENLGHISEYTIASTQGINNSHSEFAIVATEDNTVVKITLPTFPDPANNVTTFQNKTGSFDTPSLKAGEVYLVRASNLAANKNLSGTRLESCKAIAVFSGTGESGVICGNNHLYTQLLPAQKWGISYLSFPPARQKNYRIQIYASEDNTNITVNGNQQNILNKLIPKELELDTASCILADKPVQVIQFSRGKSCNGSLPARGGVSMTTLHPVSQFVKSAFFSTIQVTGQLFDQNNDHFLVLLLNQSNPVTANLSLNNQPVNPSSFIKSGTFPCSGFSYAILPLQKGSYQLTSTQLFSAYLMGFDALGTANPAYFTGVAAASEDLINSFAFSPNACVGNGTTFQFASLRNNISNLSWDFDGNGIIDVVGPNQRQPSFVFLSGGFFFPKLYVDINLGTQVCRDTLSDTIFVNPLQSNLLPQTILCRGQTATLDAGPGFTTYSWTDAKGNFLGNPRFLLVNETGIYTVKVQFLSCEATFSTEVVDAEAGDFEVVTSPALPEVSKVELDRMAFICPKQNQFINLTVDLDPSKISLVIWRNLTTGSILRGRTILVNIIGEYEATVFDQNGCFKTNSIFIEEACNPELYLPDAFSPNNDGVNDYLEFFGKGIYNLEVKIFNRWGEILFISRKKSEVWDGTFNGKEMPSGSYVWLASYENVYAPGKKIERKGKVVIVR